MLSIKNSSISGKNFFQKTINIGQNSIFTQKRDEKHPGTARNVAQTCIFWKFRHFYIKIAIWFALHCSAKKLTALWKFSIFSKNFFFQFFHRINILDFFSNYRVLVRSNQVSWDHWRSQVVMSMTSFPNYYVISDLCDRTSFLGQIVWNSIWNDILA